MYKDTSEVRVGRMCDNWLKLFWKDALCKWRNVSFVIEKLQKKLPIYTDFDRMSIKCCYSFNDVAFCVS